MGAGERVKLIRPGHKKGPAQMAGPLSFGRESGVYAIASLLILPSAIWFMCLSPP